MKKLILKKAALITVTGIMVVSSGIWIDRALASTATNIAESEAGTLSGCAQTVNDTSASNNGAVRFTDCGANLNDPTTLDETGAVIPDTAYSIPANAIFMSTGGADTNSGTLASPVKTLNKAVSLAASGGTIVVRGGIYRDWYANSSRTNYAILTKSITIQNYPHEQAWFDGSDATTPSQWASDGQGHWTMSWSTPSFCGGSYYQYAYNNQSGSTQNPGNGNTGPCAYYDTYGDPNYPAAGDPQMLFKDNVNLREVASLANVDANSFYYQQDLVNNTGTMYIGYDPTGHTTELAARPTALIVGASNVTIKGIGFQRYATNSYSGNSTSSAIYVGASNFTLENSVFRNMAAGTIGGGSTGKNSIVRHSVFANNGYRGFGWNGSQRSGPTADNLLITGNVFNANNAEHYDVGCSASCGAANVKMAHMNGFVFKNNIVENAIGRAGGVWCDLACSNSVYVSNLIKNNSTVGIFHEVSDSGIIASNMVLNNGGGGGYGIKVASANTKVYNNTIVTDAVSGYGGLWVYDDSRSPGYGGWTDVGPDTTNVSVANNIFADTQNSVTMQIISNKAAGQTNTVPGQFFALSDYNSYWRYSSAQNMFRWVPLGSSETAYKSIGSYTAATGLEAHSTEAISGSDPFFVNRAGGNYAVRSGSATYGSSTTIPDDVAAALGITQKTGQNRGALSWPGKP